MEADHHDSFDLFLRKLPNSLSFFFFWASLSSAAVEFESVEWLSSFSSDAVEPVFSNSSIFILSPFLQSSSEILLPSSPPPIFLKSFDPSFRATRRNPGPSRESALLLEIKSCSTTFLSGSSSQLNFALFLPEFFRGVLRLPVTRHSFLVYHVSSIFEIFYINYFRIFFGLILPHSSDG